MRIIQLKPLSICATNSYIVAGNKGNAVLIDAPGNAEYILSKLESENLTLKKILLTHGHFDHIGAVADIAEKTGCQVYIHKDDLAKLTDNNYNLLIQFGLDNLKKYDKAIAFDSGDVIKMDELEFRVIHTPGHTAGSCCFVLGDNIFTGDTLFARSIGRTDMPDGNVNDMLNSLKKLVALQGNYKVYPGHMHITDLDYEKKYNSYLKGSMI